MSIQHHLPSKIYYLDRLGNMSTSSCLTSSSSSASSTSSTSSTAGIGTRKQILPLKPKQPNSYVQHLEIKGKEHVSPNLVPVTVLELKKKERVDKNVVTTLTYRKPTNSVSTGSLLLDHNLLSNPSMMAPPPTNRRSGSPSSSGYDTDSLIEQENCDVFSNLLESAFIFSGHQMEHHNHEMDMLHSHPIWSPQTSSLNNNVNYFVGI